MENKAVKRIAVLASTAIAYTVKANAQMSFQEWQAYIKTSRTNQPIVSTPIPPSKL